MAAPTAETQDDVLTNASHHRGGLRSCRVSPSESQPSPLSGDGGFVSVPNPTKECDDLPRCEAACNTGSAKDCLELGQTYSIRKEMLDEARATGLFVRACDLGNGPACTFAGRMFEYAHGVEKDVSRAASLYQRSCDLAYLSGCYNSAIMLENGRGTAKDESRAYALYRRVCDAGAAPSCEGADRLRAHAEAPADAGR